MEVFVEIMAVSSSFVCLPAVAVSLCRIVEIEGSSSEAGCLICCQTSYCGFIASRLISRKVSIYVARV